MTRIIEQLAALLVTTGIPAKQSTLYALILSYLFVTGFLAVLLVVLLLRRRRRAPNKVLAPPELES